MLGTRRGTAQKSPPALPQFPCGGMKIGGGTGAEKKEEVGRRKEEVRPGFRVGETPRRNLPARAPKRAHIGAQYRLRGGMKLGGGTGAEKRRKEEGGN